MQDESNEIRRQTDTYVRVRDIVGDRQAKPPIPPIFPVSRSQWWELAKRPDAPQSFRPTPGVTVWRRSEVLRFVECLAAEVAAKTEAGVTRGQRLVEARASRRAAA